MNALTLQSAPDASYWPGLLAGLSWMFGWLTLLLILAL
jgi:hypothetical protein